MYLANKFSSHDSAMGKIWIVDETKSSDDPEEIVEDEEAFERLHTNDQYGR